MPKKWKFEYRTEHREKEAFVPLDLFLNIYLLPFQMYFIQSWFVYKVGEYDCDICISCILLIFTDPSTIFWKQTNKQKRFVKIALNKRPIVVLSLKAFYSAASTTKFCGFLADGTESRAEVGMKLRSEKPSGLKRCLDDKGMLLWCALSLVALHLQLSFTGHRQPLEMLLTKDFLPAAIESQKWSTGKLDVFHLGDNAEENVHISSASSWWFFYATMA